MVFDDLITQLKDRLNGDAYFSDPDRGIPVIDEDSMDLTNEMDVALAKLGTCVVLSVSDVSPSGDEGDGGGCVVVTVDLTAMEIPLINRAESGSRKTGRGVLVKSKSLFAKPWSPDADAWSPARFAGFSQKEVNVEHAMVVTVIRYQFLTCLETVVEVLATESGRAIGTENAEALVVSPTDP